MPSRPLSTTPASVSRTSFSAARSAGLSRSRKPIGAAPPQNVRNRPAPRPCASRGVPRGIRRRFASFPPAWLRAGMPEIAELRRDDFGIGHIAVENAYPTGEIVNRGDRGLADRGVVKRQIAFDDAGD